MTFLIPRRVFGATLMIMMIGIAASAAALDADAVIKDRQATMKQQGKDMGAIKAFLDGKIDQAAALTAATGLTETTKKIPTLFPPGTDKPSPDGDYAPKPAVWSNQAKFLDVQKGAAAKADALLAAVKTGDKPAIQTAFVDLGKNGCGSCHTEFREKLTH
ncbi:MAG TPA: cytochrome c [Stellaceae bacterium]|nr:cytochrome c [Stellaceae bacterium]